MRIQQAKRTATTAQLNYLTLEAAGKAVVEAMGAEIRAHRNAHMCADQIAIEAMRGLAIRALDNLWHEAASPEARAMFSHDRIKFYDKVEFK